MNETVVQAITSAVTIAERVLTVVDLICNVNESLYCSSVQQISEYIRSDREKQTSRHIAETQIDSWPLNSCHPLSIFVTI